MVRRTHAEMEETRKALLVAARRNFSQHGFADTSMDELTAEAGLTRGALYHHFGDKKGLLAAVVGEIDAEMDARLQAISDQAPDPWTGFRQRCRAYLEMALEPDIQRIVLRDARAVLGAASAEAQHHCLRSVQALLQQLLVTKVIVSADAQALATMIHGAVTEAAFWIAAGENPDERLQLSLAVQELLLQGLREKA